MHFFGFPSSVAELPENQTFQQPFYQQAMCDSAPAKTSVDITESTLTYNIPAPRKRFRDSFDQQLYVAPAQQKNACTAQLPAAFAGEDIFPQIQQYQYEINTIINQHVSIYNFSFYHKCTFIVSNFLGFIGFLILIWYGDMQTKKIRIELEERQKQQARLLAAAIGEGVMKKLKEKDEQIHRLGKLNLVIQDRVKSLHMENQLLRDLAQTSEATANSLRTNLERILLHIGGEERASAGGAVEEDVESCCGSSDRGKDTEGAQDKDEGNSCYSDRKCKICGEREACVLLLPCRHLCLCSGCGSGSQQLQACPICNSSMTATLHVNMSS